MLKGLGEALDVLDMVAHTADVVGCRRGAFSGRAILESMSVITAQNHHREKLPV